MVICSQLHQRVFLVHQQLKHASMAHGSALKFSRAVRSFNWEGIFQHLSSKTSPFGTPSLTYWDPGIQVNRYTRIPELKTSVQEFRNFRTGISAFNKLKIHAPNLLAVLRIFSSFTFASFRIVLHSCWDE